jgi:hypothetical protein
LIWFISSVWFIWLISSNQIDQKDQTDQIDQMNQSNQPVLRVAASSAGGGFQHMPVDINHAYARHLPIRLHFSGKSRPFPMTMLARALRLRWDKNT